MWFPGYWKRYYGCEGRACSQEHPYSIGSLTLDVSAGTPYLRWSQQKIALETRHRRQCLLPTLRRSIRSRKTRLPWLSTTNRGKFLLLLKCVESEEDTTEPQHRSSYKRRRKAICAIKRRSTQGTFVREQRESPQNTPRRRKGG